MSGDYESGSQDFLPSGVEHRKHRKCEDLKPKPAIKRELQPKSSADPAGQQIGDDPEELVQQEEKREFKRRVAECVKMQQDEHAQRAVCQGKPPIGRCDDNIVPMINHLCRVLLRRSLPVAEACGDLIRQFGHAADIAVLVIVPRKDFQLRVVHNYCR